MNTFWLKVAGVVIAVFVVAVVVNNFLSSKSEPKAEPKTFYDVIKQDDKRLRAEPKPEQIVELARSQQDQIPLEEKVQAERLFEMALTNRKMARLPGMTYKQMVDYCRQIIEKYPDSPQAPKARRMLGEVPERYWKRYNITEQEVNPVN